MQCELNIETVLKLAKAMQGLPDIETVPGLTETMQYLPNIETALRLAKTMKDMPNIETALRLAKTMQELEELQKWLDKKFPKEDGVRDPIFYGISRGLFAQREDARKELLKILLSEDRPYKDLALFV